MAGQSLIGNLAVLLSMETAAFEKGNTHAQKLMARTQRQFEQMGKKIGDIGKSLSTYVTLPVIGLGVAALKMAGDFEAGMGRVGISTQASADQMAAMRDLALDIGAKTTKSASEAADAMDMLAKAGMGTKDILAGGARAAVALAEAAGSDLDPAAAAITDTMTQFKKTTADLGTVINNITGAVNQSKFGFEDFQAGMAQAGGVAASSGVEFEDFTAALAGTASQFASGSDAGTSFKTFLMRMVPDTKKAREAMEQYGVSFYDAQGKMKSMATIAQMLQDKFAGMSEMDRAGVFKTMFGTDAIRSAIGLMQLGAKGIEDMQAKIAATDASAQAAQRMKGLNAELEKLRGSLETLAIKLADSGLLSAVSGLITRFAEWVDWMSEMHPTTLKVITVIAGLAAAVGPVLVVFGGFFKAVGFLLPLLLRMGPVLTVLASGFSYLVPLIVGATRALALMALTPIGAVISAIALAVTGAYLAWKHWDKIAPVLANLYNAAKTWLQDKLGAVFNWVGSKLTWVGDKFAWLYDVVVGHSYIPDMVDGIGRHMARLDALMVQPTQGATQKTAEAFQRLSGLLARLFPEEARQNQFLMELRQLQADAAAAKIPVDQLAEAVRRLREEYATDALGETKGISDSILKAEDLEGTVADVEKLRDLLEQMQPLGTGCFGKLSESAKKLGGNINDVVEQGLKGMMRGFGSLKDIALNVLYAIGDAIIENVLKNLISATGGGLGGILGGLGNIFRGGGGGGDLPNVIGMASGGSGIFGGRSGTDRNLLSLNGSPIAKVSRGERFAVSPEKGSGGGGLHFDLRGAVMTADLLAQMNAMADGAAVRGTVGGASMAMSRMGRARRRSLA